MPGRFFGYGRYVLWQNGTSDAYRYANRRKAVHAARESAAASGMSWVTDGDDRREGHIATYRRDESGKVYQATGRPRWIGNSAPLHGVPGRPRSIRVTDEIWDRWKDAARAQGKRVTAWLHELAEERIAITK